MISRTEWQEYGRGSQAKKTKNKAMKVSMV